METVAPRYLGDVAQCLTPKKTIGLCRHRIIELVTKHISLSKQRLERSTLKQTLLVSPEPLKQIMRHKVKLGSLCKLWRGSCQSPQQPNAQISEEWKLEQVTLCPLEVLLMQLFSEMYSSKWANNEVWVIHDLVHVLESKCLIPNEKNVENKQTKN